MERWLNSLKFAGCAIFSAHVVMFLILSIWSFVLFARGSLYWPFTDPINFFLILTSWGAYPSLVLGSSTSTLAQLANLSFAFLLAITILTPLRKIAPGRIRSGLMTALSLLPFYIIGSVRLGAPCNFDLSSLLAVWLPTVIAAGFLAGFVCAHLSSSHSSNSSPP